MRVETSAKREQSVLTADAMRRAVIRLAHEIVDRHQDLVGVVLVGVPTRGVPIALRLATTIGELTRTTPRVATLQVADHRDDRPRATRPPLATIRAADGQTRDPEIEGAVVVVVDDVIHTGRTFRAAIDALVDVGRPAAVELAVVVDRGHRELPLRPTYVGKNIPTARHQRVQVRIREIDGDDGAVVIDSTGLSS